MKKYNSLQLLGEGMDAGDDSSEVLKDTKTAQNAETEKRDAFNSNQVKSINNLNPTDNEDIRYGLQVDGDLKRYVDNVLSNSKQYFNNYEINESISEELIAGIQDILGFNASGYSNMIGRDSIIHINKRHGANGNADNTMSNTVNYSIVGDATNRFDKMWIGDGTNKAFRNSDGTFAPKIVIQKKSV